MIGRAIYEDYKRIVLKKLNSSFEEIKFIDKEVFSDTPFIIYPKKDYWEVCVNFRFIIQDKWVWFDDEYQKKIKKYVYFLKKVLYNNVNKLGR